MKKYYSSILSFIFIFMCVVKINSLNARNILLFGDSHQGAFTGIPGCHSVFKDSITMYRIGRDRENVLNLRNYNIESQDALVFIFGQIDVGWHICKQRDISGRSLEEIVRTLALNYVTSLSEITSSYPNTVKIIYSILPPSNVFVHQTLKLSYSGSLQERVWITRELNEHLRILCPMFGFEFLDVYSYYSNENGALRLELNDGSGYHIDVKYNHPIKEKLWEILRKYPEK